MKKNRDKYRDRSLENQNRRSQKTNTRKHLRDIQDMINDQYTEDDVLRIKDYMEKEEY